MNNLRILSVDARADSEPKTWYWNMWTNCGSITPDCLNWSTRKLLKWLREENYINGGQGKVTIDDDGYNLVIIDRQTLEPLFAIEYVSR